MKRQIHSFLLRLWFYKQPLTRKVLSKKSVVSDLFVWRKGSAWETSFELINLPSLFSEEPMSEIVQFVFFDCNGAFLRNKFISLHSLKKVTVNISDLIHDIPSEFGTFAVFHSSNPHALHTTGSVLSERGYCAYRYKQLPVKSFVHGNYDAIERVNEFTTRLIGGKSFLQRVFNLQYQPSLDSHFEIFIVNPTSSARSVTLLVQQADDKVIQSSTVWLAPRASHFFSFKPPSSNLRLSLRSRLVMARPLVFHYQHSTSDVFHG